MRTKKIRDVLTKTNIAAATLSLALLQASAQVVPPAGPQTEYFGQTPNWANSPLLRKFVNTLAGLGPGGANNLGQFIPVATPDKESFPGSDYYVIGLRDYTQQFHSDLPNTTKVRGYYQKNVAPGTGADENHYLGPVILAKKDTPVRVKFVNEVAKEPQGRLFIPVDKTLMGVGMGPADDIHSYTENRATLHLHGGNNPWISDGTQHQWTAPASESLGPDPTPYGKGLSVGNVPDMPEPGPGELTFYWSNQQSSRLMFYHDHAYGITRLNVYAGEAAGYLLYDDVELGLVTSGVLPDNGGGLYAFGIPLVIQDKSFVHTSDSSTPVGVVPGTVIPSTLTTDPTWPSVVPPGTADGDFWLPHVYMPNQWPDSPDLSGANPVGRWDYGPWFWPPYTGLAHGAVTLEDGSQIPGTPNPSIVPEAFMDTPLVNGTAYPVLPVARKAYRFRILNACNDRFLNLQLFKADPAQVAVPGLAMNDTHSYGTELKMVPAIPHPGAAESEWPARWPTDARDGGVPDPASAGPDMVQIGTEGGLLPAPVVIPPTPVGYNFNRRDIVVLNVASHALFLGPAERADVIIDFSGVPDGTSLILYNDSPAPVPAFDPRYDYYTGDTDLTEMGGAPTTLPGYGPNTRTIMQFQVSDFAGAPSVTAYDLAKLETELPKAFAASHPAPIVPQAGYNAAYSVDATPATPAFDPGYVDRYVRIQDTAFAFFDGPLGGIAVTAKGAGYTAPVVAITHVAGEVGTDAKATATVTAGKITAFTLTDPGSGYKAPPVVTITDPTGAGAVGTPQGAKHPLLPKAIQELFEPDYGRMNAILGVEIPNTSAAIQTTIPYFNIDPPTEIVKIGEGQFWKITHNGVDTHAIHFHLFDVQVINRVGWDGAIRPPDANELGWKDTVRMNPLEDIIVALRPLGQTLPWQLPNSVRPMDVTRPVGGLASPAFTGIDPFGNPFAVVNQSINFGYEYVWHCHLLGHEENDMMRPIILAVAPVAPSDLAAAGDAGAVPPALTLSWNDRSINETGFVLERSTDLAFTTPTAVRIAPGANAVSNGEVAAAPMSWTAPSAIANTFYYYRVRATNGVGHPTMRATSDVAYSPWSRTITWPTVDTTAPDVIAAAAPVPGASGWNTTAVKVTFSATDLPNPGAIGIASITYSATGAGALAPVVVPGGATLSSLTASFTVQAEGDTTVTFFATDNNGNSSAPQDLVLHIDRTAPTVAWAAVTPAPNANGWNNTAVTLDYTWSDSVSGLATLPATGTLNFAPEGASLTQPVTASDVAGNTATINSPVIKIDSTAPVTTASVLGGTGVGGLYTPPVQLSLGASDNLSGIEATYYTIDTVNAGAQAAYTVPAVLTENGKHTVTYWSVDKAGNVEAGQSLVIEIDSAANSIAWELPNPAPNANGWNNGPVNIGFSIVAGSGVVSTAPVSPLSFTAAGANQTQNLVVTDAANKSSTLRSPAVSIDLTAPITTATPAPAAGPSGWSGSSVAVTLASTDDLSGVAGIRYTVDGGAEQSYFAPVTVAGDGIHTLTYWGVDKADNIETAQSLTLKIDLAQPTLVWGAANPAPNAAGWNNGPVSFSYTTADTGSGVATSSPGSPVTVSAPGASQSVAVTVVDNVGNSATYNSPAVKIDVAAPVTTAGPAGTAGLNGWFRSAVTVTLTAADDLSGVASSSFTLDGGAAQAYSAPIAVSGDGPHTVTYWSMDNAGNTETVKTLTINIDTTPATLAWGAPTAAANAAGWYNAAVGFAYTTADATSGVGSSTPASPAMIDTTGLNQKQTVTVIDVAGNSASFVSPGVNIDKLAPVSTGIAVATTPAGVKVNGYFHGSVRVALTSTDDLSGVAAIYYTIDGGARLTYTTTFIVTGSLNHQVRFWGVDRAGNIEVEKLLVVPIDTVSPATSISLAGTQNGNWYRTPVTVTLTGSDAVSGVAATYYSLDGGATTQTYAAPFTVSADGAYTLQYWSVDVAGNAETKRSRTFTIDQAGPTVAVNTPVNNAATPTRLDVSGTVTDVLSGVSTGGGGFNYTIVATSPGVAYSRNGSYTINASGAFTFTTPILTAGRTYDITVSARDRAGNVTSTKVTVVK